MPSEAVTEAVKGLQRSPVLLLILCLNALTLGLILYVGSSQRDERAQLTKYLVECQKEGPH